LQAPVDVLGRIAGLTDQHHCLFKLLQGLDAKLVKVKAEMQHALAVALHSCT